MGKKVWIPIYSWYIEGADKNIIVDTAVSATNWIKSRPGRQAKDIINLREGLSKFGLTPSDIDTVVLTHLHTDHFLNIDQCKNAKAIVQEEELRFAYNPGTPFAQSYRKELYEGINFETVKANATIFPGIEVILTPGHTPGTQSVLVNTELGKVVISGFCCLYEHFAEKSDILPACMDAIAAYESIVKVKEIADIIVPLHSPWFLDVDHIPSKNFRKKGGVKENQKP
ncbi:N-acyl homoserine lactonase family protein [Thermodesulfobacteriota bacterium]